jgi:hypothetical protein
MARPWLGWPGVTAPHPERRFGWRTMSRAAAGVRRSVARDRRVHRRGAPKARTSDSFPLAFPRAPSSSSHAGLRPVLRGLENRCTRKRTEGSNPSPSVSFGLVEPNSPPARTVDARRDVSRPQRWCQRTSAHVDDRLRHRDSFPPPSPLPPHPPRAPARVRHRWSRCCVQVSDSSLRPGRAHDTERSRSAVACSPRPSQAPPQYLRVP